MGHGRDKLHPFFIDKLRKMFKRSVIGFFRIIGKTACGQLSHLQMVADAVAADPLAGASGVRTVARLEILFFFAFHDVGLPGVGLLKQRLF